MVNILLIHGAYGDPHENWFPWLKKELEKLGHQVYVPEFPTPKNQTLDNWMEVFEEYKQYLDRDAIVVAHSLGPAFIMNILERRKQPIRAAFFVAGFTGLLNNPVFDKINKGFVDGNFYWYRIKRNADKFYVFHSDNDPYVPLEKGKELAENLDAEFKLVKGAGHFNEKAGYFKFDLLLDYIKSEL